METGPLVVSCGFCHRGVGSDPVGCELGSHAIAMKGCNGV